MMILDLPSLERVSLGDSAFWLAQSIVFDSRFYYFYLILIFLSLLQSNVVLLHYLVLRHLDFL